MDWKKIVPWVALALVAFLLGYLPQRSEIDRLRAELTAAGTTAKGVDERVNALQVKVRLAELRDLASVLYLETSRKNFGTAREHSSKFFTLASELSAESNDQNLKSRLDSVVAQRDEVTSSLAKADGYSQDAALKLMERTHEDLGKK